MKKIKKQITSSFRFLFMVVILGAQAMLRGSWTHENAGQNIP